MNSLSSSTMSMRMLAVCGGLLLFLAAVQLSLSMFLLVLTALDLAVLAFLAHRHLTSPVLSHSNDPVAFPRLAVAELPSPSPSPRKAANPTAKLLITLMLVGFTGEGKSSVLASLHQSVARKRRGPGGYHAPKVAATMMEQIRRLFSHRWTERTKASLFPEEGTEGTAATLEEVILETPNVRIRLIATRGEDLMSNGGIDLEKLNQAMVAQKVDRLGLVKNPFRSARLAGLALMDLTAYWQRNAGFTFDVSLGLASTLLFGITFEGLKALNTGLELIADADLKAARIVTRRRVASSLSDFEIEGVGDGAQMLTQVLRRLADSIVDQFVESSVTADLLSLFPESIAIASRADLLPYLETCSGDDLRQVVAESFPTGHPVRMTQTVVHGSYRLELDSNPEMPVYIAGPSYDSEELVNAIEAELLGVKAGTALPFVVTAKRGRGATSLAHNGNHWHEPANGEGIS